MPSGRRDLGPIRRTLDTTGFGLTPGQRRSDREPKVYTTSPLVAAVVRGREGAPEQPLPETEPAPVTPEATEDDSGQANSFDTEAHEAELADQADEEIKGTIAEVLDWVRDVDDSDSLQARARAALNAELAKGDKARSTLIDALSEIIESTVGDGEG